MAGRILERRDHVGECGSLGRQYAMLGSTTVERHEPRTEKAKHLQRREIGRRLDRNRRPLVDEELADEIDALLRAGQDQNLARAGTRDRAPAAPRRFAARNAGSPSVGPYCSQLARHGADVEAGKAFPRAGKSTGKRDHAGPVDHRQDFADRRGMQIVARVATRRFAGAIDASSIDVNSIDLSTAYAVAAYHVNMIDLKRQAELRASDRALLLRAIARSRAGPTASSTSAASAACTTASSTSSGAIRASRSARCCAILGVTKQALNAPLRQLIEMNLVSAQPATTIAASRSSALTADGANARGAAHRHADEAARRGVRGRRRSAEGAWKRIMRSMPEKI